MSVTLHTAPNRIEFLARGERFASYDYRGGLPGFTSLFAPECRALTRPDAVSGLSLWIGHDDVSGIAFGAKEEHLPRETDDLPRAGRIVTVGMTARRGTQSVGFQQECHWIAPEGQTLLHETRTVRVTPGPCEGGILDLTMHLRAPEDRPVLMGRTERSLVHLSAASPLLPAGGGQIRSSANGYDIETIHGQSAAWCACTGVVQGETAGFVLLDHPGNLWHPAFWVAADGMLGPAPFRGRSLEITPQKSLLLRYRLQTYRGSVEAGWIRERLAEFAHSPLRV